MYNIDFFHHNETVQSRKSLSSNRSKSSTGYTPVKPGNKNKIQDHIDNRSNEHSDQRRSAVAKSTQHGGKNIIGGNDRNSAENDPEIDQRHPNNIIRCIQKHQDPSGSKLTDDQKRNSSDRCKQITVCNCFLKVTPFPGTIMLRDQNRKPLRNSGRNAEYHPHDPFHRTKGSQSLNPGNLSDNDRIHHRIQLLKNIPQHQRHCKKQDQLRRGTLRHITNLI